MVFFDLTLWILRRSATYSFSMKYRALEKMTLFFTLIPRSFTDDPRAPSSGRHLSGYSSVSQRQEHLQAVWQRLQVSFHRNRIILSIVNLKIQDVREGVHERR